MQTTLLHRIIIRFQITVLAQILRVGVNLIVFIFDLMPGFVFPQGVPWQR